MCQQTVEGSQYEARGYHDSAGEHRTEFCHEGATTTCRFARCPRRLQRFRLGLKDVRMHIANLVHDSRGWRRELLKIVDLRAKRDWQQCVIRGYLYSCKPLTLACASG